MALVEKTATGDVTATSVAATYLRSVNLTADSAAAVAEFRKGGAGGTIVLTLKAPIQTSTFWSSKEEDGQLITGGLHLTLTGAGARCAIEY